MVNDSTATVEVNGIKASVSPDGRFLAKGITLSEGANLITAKVRDITGRTNSYSITVNYQPKPVTPISVVITSPVANAQITKPFVMVTGTHTSQAQEVSIKVWSDPHQLDTQLKEVSIPDEHKTSLEEHEVGDANFRDTSHIGYTEII
ncbi:MAG TPA: hypothetical protein VN328_04380, partial [Thermodesulfovibrionales bacterium]|nr:hypothetical protein [Thermodesulfovibrionales bacterium]